MAPSTTRRTISWTSWPNGIRRVFAFLMGAQPGQSAVLRSFGEGEHIRSVRLLGVGEVPFVHQFGVLTAQMPERLPTQYVPCLAVTLV